LLQDSIYYKDFISVKISNKICAMITILLVVSLSVYGTNMNAITPPKAKKQGTKDLYHWLNQRDTPEVLEYLKAENDYTQKIMEPTLSLQKELAEEIKNRIKEDDSTVPVKKDHYYYYVRFEKDKSYPIYCRKRDDLNHPEEIILDVNALAKDHAYYNVEAVSISPNENLLAFAEDTQGRRKWKIIK
jgi:oligopeptidase B